LSIEKEIKEPSGFIHCAGAVVVGAVVEILKNNMLRKLF